MKTETAGAPRSTAPEVAALSVTGLRKVYRNRRGEDVVAVDDVSFSVQPGEVVGLLGPNGAGKTTTIKCLCTLVIPEAGEIWVDGIDAIKRPRRAVSRVAAVLEGNRNTYWRLTPTENMEYFAALHGISPRGIKGEISEILDRLGLTEKADVPVRKLSRGMQQKLAVATAFIKNTPVLFLDEPTLGLDVETSYNLREELKAMASERDRTIFLSSHDMDVVQDLCERVIIINHGRIITDDKVDNLLELFKARAYRFGLSSPLDDGQQAEVKNLFPMVKVESDAHSATIEVELLEASRLFDLVDLVRKFGGLIESIDRQDPDLEEIFLRIVKGEIS